MDVAEAVQGFGLYAATTGRKVKLAMQDLHLGGTILPVGGRLVVRHVLCSAEKNPLEVVYAFMLPRDAAMRRFRIVGGDFETHSELRPVREASELYEKGIERGHLAVMARAYGDGVVNLNVGNIRPGETITVFLEIAAGVELHDDGFRFRFPFTLAPGYHARASVAELAPGVGEMSLPEELFGDMVLPEWHADARGLHRVGFDLSVEAADGVMELASPSHPVSVRHEATGARASLAVAVDVPDRDLVLDVRYGEKKPLVLAGADAAGKRRFAVLVPSTCFGQPERVPKRAVFLLDRSGSMSGPPMDQAKKAIEACLGALGGEDRFSIVAFDTACETLGGFERATMPAREAARRFLAGIDARGGTELAKGVDVAAKMLGSEGGEILLLTDGQVFETETILARAKQSGIRIHCLGIGSASQDRFLSQIASQTGGTGRFVTPRERVDLAVLELFAGIGSPVATGIRLESVDRGSIETAPEPAGTVFAGTPYVAFGSCDGGEERFCITWNDGGASALELPVVPVGGGLGDTLKLLQGARLTTVAELQIDPKTRFAGDRNVKRIDRRLTELAKEYGLANRMMALVAVVNRKGDRAGQLPTMQVVPVGMPQDVDMAKCFHVQSSSLSSLSYPDFVCDSSMACLSSPEPAERLSSLGKLRSRVESMSSSFSCCSESASPAAADSETDRLMAIAAAMEADGGMPGRDEDERAVLTLLALLEFHEAGHTATGGPFAVHVRRLWDFLDMAVTYGLGAYRQEILARVAEALRDAKTAPGPWLKPAGRRWRMNAGLSPAEVLQTLEKSL